MPQAWQNIPDHLNPIAFRLGPVEIFWYGIMYLVAFAIVYYLVRYRIRTEKMGISFETVQDFFPWAIVGLLLGARLGDVFIYDWSYFSKHPLEIFLPFDIYNHWQYIGIYGMSYFGGLVGLAIALYLFCKIKKINLLEFSDLFSPAVPLAFTFGRLGNFINGELYGRITNKFWGMYFPADFSGQLRHPSQLYEALLEGILLFAILWNLRKKNYPAGYLTAFYLIGYGIARFTGEFFREPDKSWFFNPKMLSSGQVFSLLLIFAALFLLILKRSKRRA
ncbi:MAG: prolipoprotein diacylglyceryl transferase [Candidatus Moranbacteria bacterium]|nr:prolipoprotein diacylglyceryl transferase [Candidatus Moranbacteria bacterium]